jgi:HSP20 family protein
MSLIHYRPKNSPADSIQELLSDDFFYAPFFPASVYNKRNENWFPALDVSEDANQYTIEADVPGLKKEDVRLSFDNGVLTIEGERKSETEKKDKNYHRVERTYGKFVRSLNLGTGVDANAIRAHYKEGVLNITVPKSEKAKPKAIDIHVG